MFFDDGSGTVQFNVAEFQLRNLDPQGFINSFFSDYVAFDISNMPTSERPQLTTGEFATRVYFSGDDTAISAGGQSGKFEVLTLDATQPIMGSYGPQNVLQGTPGTYNLEQVDPTDLSGISRITSIHGIWRDLNTVITGVSDFEMITFPKNADTAEQDLVIVQRSGGVITGLYFGFVNFDERKFRAYPIKNVVDASAEGELTGTVTGLMTANGSSTVSLDSTRYGQYSFDAGQTLPAGFQNTGTFIVFRK
jgi:hypothetical protein